MRIVLGNKFGAGQASSAAHWLMLVGLEVDQIGFGHRLNEFADLRNSRCASQSCNRLSTRHSWSACDHAAANPAGVAKTKLS